MNGYIHNREELKPIHDEVASWAERSFVIGGIAHHKQQDLEQRIAKHVDPMLARIKELEEALRALMDAINPINYPARKWNDPANDISERGIGSRTMPDEQAVLHAYRAILNKR